jgi:hypothetical protein
MVIASNHSKSQTYIPAVAIAADDKMILVDRTEGVLEVMELLIVCV